MQLKDVIAISIFLLIYNSDVLSQKNRLQYEILNDLPTLVGKGYTYNDDSIMRIIKNPINPDWNKLLNFNLLERNISWSIDTSKYDTPFEPYPVTEILSQKDLEYMYMFYNAKKTFRWKNRFVQNTFIKVIKRRIKLDSNKKIQGYHQVSLPVFSVNYSVAIIQIVHICGIDCGNSILLILKKNNEGRWKRVCTVSLWMS